MIVHVRRHPRHPRGLPRLARLALAALLCLSGVAVAVLATAGFLIRLYHTGDWFLTIPAALAAGLIGVFTLLAVADALKPHLRSQDSGLRTQDSQ